MQNGDVKAFAHITGGGLLENIPRILPDGLGVRLDAHKWKMNPVFGWLAEKVTLFALDITITCLCNILRYFTALKIIIFRRKFVINSKISSLWLSSEAVWPDLCWTLSETPQTGFVVTRLMQDFHCTLL